MKEIAIGKNMSSLLADHESSMKHIRAIGAWIELENRSKEGKTIDMESQKLMQKETQHWNNVFTKNHFNCAVSLQNGFSTSWHCGSIVSTKQWKFFGIGRIVRKVRFMPRRSFTTYKKRRNS